MDSSKFATLERDAETGLDHAEARQYAPWMGRWTAPDPYNGSYDIYDPQSMNRYTYVNNNPLAYNDPTGYDSADAPSETGSGTSDGSVDGSSNDGSNSGDGSSYYDSSGYGGSGYGSDGTGGNTDQSTYTLTITITEFDYQPPTVVLANPPGDCVVTSSNDCSWLISQFQPPATQAPNIFRATNSGGNAPKNSSGQYPTRMFGTHWCGPGGAGPAVNQLDAACKAHDQCYDANGFTPWSNWNPIQSPGRIQALQRCNQNLCNAAAQTNNPGSTRVFLFFQQVVPVGACKP